MTWFFILMKNNHQVYKEDKKAGDQQFFRTEIRLPVHNEVIKEKMNGDY